MATRVHGRRLRRLHHVLFFQSANLEPDDGRRLVPGGGERDFICRPLPRRGLGGAFLRRHSHPVTPMDIPHEATLLRIFIGESDRYENRPLYEAIILKAREMHLAGATALRGPIGFGKSSRMHTSKILRLSMDLPMIIEIVDSEEKIQTFLPVLDGMITGGLVTIEKIRAIDYRGAVSGDAE